MFKHPLLPVVQTAGTLCRDDQTTSTNPMLDRLREERQKHIDFMDETLAKAQDEKRDLVDAEKNNLTSARARIKELDDQIKPLEEFEALRGASSQAQRAYRPTASSQPGEGVQTLATQVNTREHQYRSAGEFLADAWKAQNRSDEQARGRLQTHGVTFEGGVMLRAAAPHTTTAETPGLLPVPIVGEIMKNIDAARPFVSSIGAKDLGGIPGTSFKRPIVTQSVNVGKQTAEKTEVEDGQFKVGSIDFSKETYGGWTNVSRQDIDWTSPGVWDALLTDFQEQYGLQTENVAADDFQAAVTAVTGTEVADPDAPTVANYLSALYQAAALAYAGSGRLPDTIWASLDMWATMGPLIDQLKASTAGNGGGDSSLGSFGGNLLNVPRIVVPSFPEGTLIVGVKSRTEVYEDRIGFLSAVQPKVFGVELAYGGYMANGTLKPDAFAKVTFTAASAG